MPDAALVALAEPGLTWICGAALLAGLVYGFAGFGSALVFIPLATVFIPPPVAVAAYAVCAMAAFVTVVPGAWKVADTRGVLVMVAGCIVMAPAGVAALRLASEEVLRAAIGALTLATLAALILGWRVPVGAGRGAQAIVGGLAGLTGGSTGLNGPPVILFNLGTSQPVAVTRANLACFLTITSVTFLPQLWLQGLLPPQSVWLGVILLVPYALGSALGSWFFTPRLAGFYRRFAYALIGCAGVTTLPIWGA